MNTIRHVGLSGLVLLLFVVAVPTLRSQEFVVPAQTTDSFPSVDAILDRYVSALGGKEAIEKR